jgi:hypothetical protein
MSHSRLWGRLGETVSMGGFRIPFCFSIFCHFSLSIVYMRSSCVNTTIRVYHSHLSAVPIAIDTSGETAIKPPAVPLHERHSAPLYSPSSCTTKQPPKWCLPLRRGLRSFHKVRRCFALQQKGYREANPTEYTLTYLQSRPAGLDPDQRVHAR